jgi:very-short-patch-repair endonuclease
MEKSFSRYKDTPKYITDLAWKNRINPTVQEEKLWSIISGKKLNGLKFRRQFPIGRYIVDFYNHVNRLVIEIDGSIHETTKEYDGNRDAYLHSGGYKVLRFTNSEIESVLSG